MVASIHQGLKGGLVGGVVSRRARGAAGLTNPNAATAVSGVVDRISVGRALNEPPDRRSPAGCAEESPVAIARPDERTTIPRPNLGRVAARTEAAIVVRSNSGADGIAVTEGT